jgi:UDP-GlcNAc3NAcA epimerase
MKIKKIVSIVGARPQFVKAAVLSRLFRNEDSIDEVLVHTGQHYDASMSDVFFEEMEIPKPKYNLEVSSLSHGTMTGRMLEKIEEVLVKEKPDLVLVYGDTNSTLAGALAAKKMHIPLAHVEAGLRSFDMEMPEEVNRIITDRISSVLFAPTFNAIKNLQKEGYDAFDCKIVLSGDIMQDAAVYYASKSSEKSKLPSDLPEKFILGTLHRAENTDNYQRLKSIVESLNEINREIPIVLPLHPRTKKMLEASDLKLDVHVLDPVGYFEMIELLKKCEMVMTDSGGLQKEAYFFKKPCLTLRDQTEWIELVKNGFNKIVGADKKQIIAGYREMIKAAPDYSKDLYGGGKAGEKILAFLKKGF